MGCRANAEQCFIYGRTHRRRALRQQQSERLRAYAEAHWHGLGIYPPPWQSGKARPLSVASYASTLTACVPCTSNRANVHARVCRSSLAWAGHIPTALAVRQSAPVERRFIRFHPYRLRAMHK